ncbi:hypothetical protein OAK75_12180, partial [Bacteriovoracales bacterium]|nr:hypothetical protein [Bacteriovoracales bacterium]
MIFRKRIDTILLFLFFIFISAGIWHGLPLKNIFDDEMYFVGGVFRNLSQFSILPGKEIPYGIIFYYINFFIDSVIVGLLIPFFKFNLGALKDWMALNSHYFYLVPRIISTLSFIFLFVLLNKFLQSKIKENSTRWTILFVTFFNLIVLTYGKTGKVWPLATVLWISSLTFLFLSLETNGEESKKNFIISSILTGLCTSNFALMSFSFINFPIYYL